MDDGTVILVDLNSIDDGNVDNSNNNASGMNIIKREALIHALSFSPDGII